MYGMTTGPTVFGIDLDDTITKEPLLFKKIIEMLKDHGCVVYIVTARDNGSYCDVLREVEPLVDKVYFTSATAKQDVVEVDIWIDDFPLAITHSFNKYQFMPGEKIKEERWLK